MDFFQTPHLILTKVEVDSKLLEYFLSKHCGNSSSVLSPSPEKCSPLSCASSRTSTSELQKLKTKPRLKRLVAKPTSLVVSFRLEGEFKEFIVKRFTRSCSSKQKVVSDSFRKTIQTPSPNALLTVRSKAKKTLQRSKRSEIEQNNKGHCTKSNTSSDKSHVSNHTPDVATAVPNCELEDKTLEDIDEVFKALEVEVDSIQLQQLPKGVSFSGRKTSSNKKQLSKHSEFLEDLPEDSAQQLPVKSVKKKRKRRDILDSSSEEECEDPWQLKVLNNH